MFQKGEAPGRLVQTGDTVSVVPQRTDLVQRLHEEVVHGFHAHPGAKHTLVHFAAVFAGVQGIVFLEEIAFFLEQGQSCVKGEVLGVCLRRVDCVGVKLTIMEACPFHRGSCSWRKLYFFFNSVNSR